SNPPTACTFALSKPSRTFRKLRQSRPDNPRPAGLGIPLRATHDSLPRNRLCRELALFRNLLVRPPEGRARVMKITNLHYNRVAPAPVEHSPSRGPIDQDRLSCRNAPFRQYPILQPGGQAAKLMDSCPI